MAPGSGAPSQRFNLYIHSELFAELLIVTPLCNPETLHNIVVHLSGKHVAAVSLSIEKDAAQNLIIKSWLPF